MAKTKEEHLNEYYRIVPHNGQLLLADRDGNIVPGQVHISAENGMHDICEVTVTLLVKAEDSNG